MASQTLSFNCQLKLTEQELASSLLGYFAPLWVRGSGRSSSGGDGDCDCVLRVLWWSASVQLPLEKMAGLT